MKEKLVIFNGLYGENNYSSLLEFVHAEPLESRSKMYNWEIKEHLHTDLVQLFVIESGNGILVSEKKESIISGPSIVFIPINTLHGFIFQDNVKGEVITFSDYFLENNFKQNQKIVFELNHLQCFNFERNNTHFEQIKILKEMIIKELNEENIEKRTFINSLFQTLFLAIFRVNQIQKTSMEETDNKTLKYFQIFQKSIKQDYSEMKTISQYAKEIGITTMHLNRVCKIVIGKSPLQILHELVVAEAKKYLLNTSYSISEISYFLNFNDPAYFTRLFKKNVGVSPSDFRKT
ncbi:helix-turn-helix domain-containing protein [Lacihabitans sp. CS3-21]|uniref:helix-turn-helix domain-containing protein n=1 Tax=Lacihabitans sp. CS3-21 TaxID=2487332 RepID=UPI0020CEDB4A|nr:helix-turn-helix domain-containing protein [Lacihabitans sp. CS3-21]MCP9747349.1 helix-turn-helix domain-containing protein [Lacihabitans sp. CS3-21]